MSSKFSIKISTCVADGTFFQVGIVNILQN